MIHEKTIYLGTTTWLPTSIPTIAAPKKLPNPYSKHFRYLAPSNQAYHNTLISNSAIHHYALETEPYLNTHTQCHPNAEISYATFRSSLACNRYTYILHSNLSAPTWRRWHLEDSAKVLVNSRQWLARTRWLPVLVCRRLSVSATRVSQSSHIRKSLDKY